jgi:predicted negative regulator of RcsB-dependent stress response
MKRTEREHLKEDPFQQFIENAIDILRQYKKYILIGVGIIAALIVIIVAVNFFHAQSVASENLIYSDALKIKNDKELDVEQKIEKLTKLETKNGLSSSVKLFLATLHYEKGDLEASRKVLEAFSKSSIDLINEQKQLLEAEILASSNKNDEALKKLNQILADNDSELAKDYILLKMAKIQVKTNQKETAVANLNKLMEDFPQSFYSYEARTLLTQIEDKK